MYKILVTGSIHQIGLEILRKEKDIEIQYALDLPLSEIFPMQSLKKSATKQESLP